MTSASDTIRIALLALVTGAVLPVLVQLFLAARSLRSAVETIERRLDSVGRQIGELAADVKAQTGKSTPLWAAVGAAAPAIAAAVHAFRVSMHEHHSGDVGTAAQGRDGQHAKEDGKESAHESLRDDVAGGR
jgi:hypothetical protein